MRTADTVLSLSCLRVFNVLMASIVRYHDCIQIALSIRCLSIFKCCTCLLARNILTYKMFDNCILKFDIIDTHIPNYQSYFIFAKLFYQFFGKYLKTQNHPKTKINPLSFKIYSAFSGETIKDIVLL